MWRAWDFDYTTWGWVIWIAYFAIWETYTGLSYRNEMLTDHLRPFFQSGGYLSILWFIAVGIWLWIGVHFLIDGLFINKPS